LSPPCSSMGSRLTSEPAGRQDRAPRRTGPSGPAWGCIRLRPAKRGCAATSVDGRTEEPQAMIPPVRWGYDSLIGWWKRPECGLCQRTRIGQASWCGPSIGGRRGRWRCRSRSPRGAPGRHARSKAKCGSSDPCYGIIFGVGACFCKESRPDVFRLTRPLNIVFELSFFTSQLE